MHWMIIVGFALAFYIQLHNDYAPDEHNKPNEKTGEIEPNTFYDIVNLPIKIIAMAIGEFEYGDMPFRNFSMDQFLFLNRLTFILFVYFIGIVQFYKALIFSTHSVLLFLHSSGHDELAHWHGNHGCTRNQKCFIGQNLA